MTTERDLNPDDVFLAAQVMRGDAQAIDRWYRRDWPGVWRICFGFLTDATEADDAAQEAMVKLMDRLGTWDRSRPYRSWRATVVANLCRDRLRRMKARRDAETRAMAERLPSMLPRVSPEIEQNEVRGLLEAALVQLSPREREVFILRDLEDTPTEDVAATLEIDQSTVRSMLTLARRRLRDLLSKRLQLNEGERP